MPEDIEAPLILKVLLQKYSLLKQEVWLYSSSYENHITYLQFGLAALVAAVAFLFSKAAMDLGSAMQIPRAYVLLAASFAITTAAFLLVFKVFDTNYRLTVIAARMAILEDDINARLGERVLLWESFLVENFSSVRDSFRWKNPSIYMAGFYFLLLAFCAVGIPVFLWRMALDDQSAHGVVFSGLLVLDIAYIALATCFAAFVGIAVHGGMRGEAKAQMLAIMHAAGIPQGRARP